MASSPEQEIPQEIIERLREKLNVGAPPSSGHLRLALATVLPDLLRRADRIHVGQINALDKAHRVEVERLTDQIGRLEDALDAAQPDPDLPRCEAVCYAGPGHQSCFRCELPIGHDTEDEPHRYSEVRFEWTEDGECVGDY